MGDWDTAAYWNRDVLERIVALLFSLAGLADRAAALPARRRREVLGFLMHGEAVARTFVLAMALGGPVETDGPQPACEPEVAGDAAALAAHLRLLGFVLWFLLAQGQRLARSGAAGPRAFRVKPAGSAATPPRHHPAPDTS